MARNAVGSLSVLITANAGGFDATVTQVGKDVENLHKRIKPPKPIDLGFAGTVAGLAGVGSAGAVVAKVLGSIEENAKLGGAARAMGLTAQQFTGIAAVARNAGEDSREFIESLVTMGKVIDDGLTGKGEVAADFFKTIGVDARAFAGLRTDQQFFKIFEALERMQDPAKRVRALMVAFGEDGGKALLNALGQSAAEMRRFAAEAAISNEKMKEIEKTAKRMREASAAWDKATTELAVGSAPAVQAAADATPFAIGFTRRLIGMADGLNGTIIQTAGHVARFAGAVGGDRGKRVDDPTREKNALERFGDRMVAEGWRHIGLGRGLMGTGQMPPPPNNPPPVNPPPVNPPGVTPPAVPDKAMLDAMAKLRVDAADPGQKWAAEQKRLNDLFLVNRKEADLFARAWHEGWRTYANDALRAIDDPIRRWQEAQRLMAEGVRNRTLSPDEARGGMAKAFDEQARFRRDALQARGGGEFDRFQLDAQLLQQQFRAGLIERRAFEAGMGKLVTDLDGVMERHEVQLPAAMLKGTQEVESLLSRAMTGKSANDPTARLQAALARLEAKQITEEKIAAAFGRELEKRLQFRPAGK